MRTLVLEHVKRRYRELAIERHPDHGGSAEGMVRLHQAYEAAKNELS